MRAVVSCGNGRLGIREVPVPNPEKDEVVIEVKVCGLCGSEKPRRKKAGEVIGHEIAGIVVKTMESGRLQPGDKVVLRP